MDILNKFGSYLIEFDYPNINSLNNEQIADIFAKENRFFLLTWIVKNVNSNFEIPTEWSSDTIDKFADLFYEIGFCLPSQKYGFVRGDSTLDVEEEILIFERIFMFVKNTAQKENVQPKTSNTNSIEDINVFLKKDINLFPHYGPLKCRSSNEIIKKKLYYKEKIEKLQESINTNEEVDKTLEVTNCDKEWKENCIQNIKEHSERLKKNVPNNFQQSDTFKDFMKEAGFKSSVNSRIVKCNDIVGDTLKYFKNIKLNQSLADDDTHIINNLDEDDTIEVLKQHVQLSSEIVREMLKN